MALFDLPSWYIVQLEIRLAPDATLTKRKTLVSLWDATVSPQAAKTEIQSALPSGAGGGTCETKYPDTIYGNH